MTIKEVKRKLIDTIGYTLSTKKDCLTSEDFVNISKSVFILMESDMYEDDEEDTEREEAKEKFDFDKYMSGIKNLYNPNNKD